ncbi:MAG: glycerol-3-phosphate acyltransferase [Desulfatibacillaceae bacterium]
MTWALLVLSAYVAGSVNFSILLFRLLGFGDPRERFSGNPGVTNVYRQAGPPWAGAVLCLDMGRSAGVCLLALWLGWPGLLPWVALGLLVGNRWPAFHGFSGGKGVANYLGFTLAAAPLHALVSGAMWFAVTKPTGQPFLGSFAMVAVLSTGLYVASGGGPVAMAGVLACTVFIVWNHLKNIREFVGQRPK